MGRWYLFLHKPMVNLLSFRRNQRQFENNISKEVKKMKKIIILIALILSCWGISAWADNKTPLKTEPAPAKEISQSATAPAAFQLPWSSINGGGEVTMYSTNYQAKG